jgi:hypothetical protein
MTIPTLHSIEQSDSVWLIRLVSGSEVIEDSTYTPSFADFLIILLFDPENGDISSEKSDCPNYKASQPRRRYSPE